MMQTQHLIVRGVSYYTLVGLLDEFEANYLLKSEICTAFKCGRSNEFVLMADVTIFRNQRPTVV